MLGRKPVPAIQRFMAKVSIAPTGCWLWNAATTKRGYAVFSPGRPALRGHRWIYEYHNGKIPAGLQLDHLCKTRNCVNPSHLEAVTPRENNARSTSPSSVNSRKTQCIRGHVFTADNIIRRPNNRRECRACARIRDKQRRAI